MIGLSMPGRRRLAMLVDTMIPDAFEVAHDFAGFVTVAGFGFLAAFALGKLGGRSAPAVRCACLAARTGGPEPAI